MAAHARQPKGLAACKRCGRHTDECGALSWVGQCLDCAEERLRASVEQLQSRSGPMFECWRSGIVRAVQRL